MNKECSIYYFLFPSFLILTVILLIPGPGLTTIPIPDENSDTLIGAIADSPDFSKRIIQNTSVPFLYLTIENNSHLNIHLLSTDITSIPTENGALLTLLAQSIRAPPIV